jgi:hypothetical protein
VAIFFGERTNASKNTTCQSQPLGIDDRHIVASLQHCFD